MNRKQNIREWASQEIYGHLNNIISSIPKPQARITPHSPVRDIIQSSAVKSSSISAALSIPGGIAGVASAIPDILAVWKIQSQMISNIAAIHGKDPLLSQEQMLWCMFRQMAVGMGKELVVQQGSKYVVQRLNRQVTSGFIQKIGHNIIRTQSRRLAGRIVPLAGSITAGALTYYDTMRVGRNAEKLYSADLVLLPE